MKIALIRSVDIKQASPTLNNIKKFILENNITVKVFFTDGECDKSLFPGEFEKVSSQITSYELAEKIAEWKADAVITISLPDDNSLRDACVSVILEKEFGIPMISHPLNSTATLCNKWETNLFLKKLGYPVPRAFLISGDLLNKRGIEYGSYRDYMLSILNNFNFPVIVKPLWDSMSTGIVIINSLEELNLWLSSNQPLYDLSVEEFIDGELFGIEVLGMDGNYICQPLIKKCTGNNESLIPFDHLRFGPILEKDYNIDSLKQMVVDISRSLDLKGSAEFELIYSNNQFYIIEINPRVSGMTNLSSAISGNNAYELLLRMAMESWNGALLETENLTFTVELPLINMTEEKKGELTKISDVFHVSDVVYHDGSTQYKMLLQGVNAEDCLIKLQEINKKLMVIPDYIIKELEENSLEIMVSN